MKVAIIDLGTNSFHLIIADVNEKNYEIIYRKREVIHLRTNSEVQNYFIENDKKDLAIKILSEYHNITNKYNAKIYAFATSAVRDALNKNDFVDEVKKKLNFDIQILSGDEEAELISFGINFHYDVQNKNVLMFDLGGGSTEFVYQVKSKIKFKKSLNIGAVRQTQKWFNNFLFDNEKIISCINEINYELEKINLNGNIDQSFGIGGTLTAITWLIEKNIYNREHNFKVIPDYVITKKDFVIIKELIIKHALKNELNKLIGIDDQRIKIIVAGILIVDSIFEHFNLESILIPGISIRESFLIKMFLSNL